MPTSTGNRIRMTSKTGKNSVPALAMKEATTENRSNPTIIGPSVDLSPNQFSARSATHGYPAKDHLPGYTALSTSALLGGYTAKQTNRYSP